MKEIAVALTITWAIFYYTNTIILSIIPSTSSLRLFDNIPHFAFSEKLLNNNVLWWSGTSSTFDCVTVLLILYKTLVAVQSKPEKKFYLFYFCDKLHTYACFTDD